MFIQSENTPNPSTRKFLPGKPVLPGGTAEFRDKAEAAASPLALRLFETGGVERVFLGSDFISVTKGDIEWQHLAPLVLGAIMEHYLSGAPILSAGATAVGQTSGASETETGEGAGVSGYDPADAETVKTIQEILETRVRPAVAQDGGDITFAGFRNGVVYLHMRGACSGCPSSTATLRQGVESLLRHFCPDVVSVQAA